MNASTPTPDPAPAPTQGRGRGRPPQGAALAWQLAEEDPVACERLHALLQTLTGEASLDEIAARWQVSREWVRRQRRRALEAAADVLRPAPAGRPRAAEQIHPLRARIALLEEQVRAQRIELEAARVRAELALVMPHVGEKNERRQPPQRQPARKTSRRRRDRQRRQKAPPAGDCAATGPASDGSSTRATGAAGPAGGDGATRPCGGTKKPGSDAAPPPSDDGSCATTE